MTQHSQKLPASRGITRLAEGLASAVILFIVTVITLVCIAVFSTHWQGVTLFLFGD